MQNHQNMLKLVERLCDDSEMELTREELEGLLNEELSKPEEQMDVELVQEILLMLEDGASELTREAAWDQTRRMLRGRRMHPILSWTIRIAATLAIVLGLTLLTYKTAEAFNWQPVLRLMQPLAETFTLYSGGEPAQSHEVVAVPRDAYVLSGKLEKPQQYVSAQEVPQELCGYPVRPAGVPERFTYLQGSAYSDDLNTTMTHVYSAADGVCIFSVLILNGDGQTTSHQYERTVEETREKYIAGCRVVYYFNSDDSTMSASWTMEYAQYSVFGAISEEELTRIVESTMSR